MKRESLEKRNEGEGGCSRRILGYEGTSKFCGIQIQLQQVRLNWH